MTKKVAPKKLASLSNTNKRSPALLEQEQGQGQRIKKPSKASKASSQVKSTSQLQREVKELSFKLDDAKKKHANYEKELLSIATEITSYNARITKLEARQLKALELLKEKKKSHRQASNNLVELEKEIKTEAYETNSIKVKTQNKQDPLSYKMLGLYLSVTSFIGILLAVYYFAFFNNRPY